MKKFTATIEFLMDQGAAIIALFDESGEWSGAGRIDLRTRTNLRAALYDAGYTHASRAAAAKGGRLERFSYCPMEDR